LLSAKVTRKAKIECTTDKSLAQHYQAVMFY
jgi:hypothetical protein